MRGRFGVALVLAVLFAGMAPTIAPARADSLPPTVARYWTEPRYPIQPQNTTLFAEISDPDGVAVVYATWCTVPSRLCQYPILTDPDGDGIWSGYGAEVGGDAYIWIDGGAGYKVYAEDTVGNGITTAPLWVLFAHSLNVNLDPPVVGGAPSTMVPLHGTAHFDGNGTAPAENVSVSVAFNEAVYRGTVDATGNFTVDLPAPPLEGSYPVDVTATDRNLTGTAHGSMAVSTVPKPDLTVENVVVSPADLVAGHEVYLSFDIVNLGTEDASGVRVVVTLTLGGTTNVLLNESWVVPAGGARIHRVAPWSPEAGTQTVRIRLDPANAIAELDETNNGDEIVLTVSPAPDTGVSPLVWMGVGGGVAAAVAAAAVVFLRRRKAP